LLGSYCYHRRVKQVIKEDSLGQIRFHIKGIIEEMIVELAINDIDSFAMTKLRIPEGKLRIIDDNMLYNNIIVTNPDERLLLINERIKNITN
jgi:hypothetical protein